MLLFPEGTRSEDGDLRSFSSGPMSLARRAGVKLLPIVIDGTRGLLPKSSFVFGLSSSHTLHVRVLEPVDAASAAPKELSRKLRERMSTELDLLRS